MFEQSLYETTPVATPLEQGDLFHNYEIKNWEFSPRIYKILAMAGGANLLALLIVAQTSVLTMKGCDSPLVGQVCEVLDTVYISSMLFGTKRDYVDAAYDKIDLGDAEITYVDVSGDTPPLSYPEGYFQLANPDEYQAMLTQANNPTSTTLPDMTGFPNVNMSPPSFGGSSLIDTKPHFPKPPKGNVVDGDLPTVDDLDPNPKKSTVSRVKGPNMGRPTTPKAPGTPKPTPDTTTTAEKKNDPTSEAPTTYDINKRPFVDLANNVNDLLDKKQLKLESAFVVNAAGKLTKEGKLDPKTFRWGQIASPDQKMVDVVKGAIGAINDSGYLQYLKDISGKDFNLMLQQDDTNISAVVQSEMETDLRAKSIRDSLSLMISIAKMKKSGAEADQNDKDDLILLENAKVETDGKKVVIKFLVPKEIALPMIQRKLAEQKAAPKQQNGNAIVRPANNATK